MIDLRTRFVTRDDAESAVPDYEAAHPGVVGKVHVVDSADGGFQLAIRDLIAPILPFTGYSSPPCTPHTRARAR